MSRAQRVWVMVGGAVVAALPIGLLMSFVPDGGAGERLLSFVWLGLVVAWCVWVARKWSVPPRTPRPRGGGARGARGVVWSPASDDLSLSGNVAYMYHYVHLPPPGLYWVDVEEGLIPDRMRGERSAFVYSEGALVGGVTPHWLQRYGSRLPLRVVLLVNDDGEGRVLFPE